MPSANGSVLSHWVAGTPSGHACVQPWASSTTIVPMTTKAKVVIPSHRLAHDQPFWLAMKYRMPRSGGVSRSTSTVMRSSQPRRGRSYAVHPGPVRAK